MRTVHSLDYAVDYFVLWAFGKLTLLGQNSYDQDSLRSTLDSLGIDFSSDALSGHVPWILWLYAIFSILPFPASRVLWLAFSVSSLGAYAWWCAIHDYLRRNLSEAPWVPILIAIFSFFPLLNTARWGQSNFLICLGLMGFLYYRDKNDDRSAGLSLSFMFVKPHLFVPFFSFLTAQAIRQRKYTSLAWCLFALVFQLYLTAMLSPATVYAYPAEVSRAWSATQFTFMPSAALLLAHFTNIPHLRPTLLCLGAVIGIAFGLKTPGNFNRSLSVLLPLGFLVAPFCWSHTFVVLLPQYLKLASIAYLRNQRLYLLFVVLFVSFQTYISMDPSMSQDALNVVIPVGIFLGSMLVWKGDIEEVLYPQSRNSACNLT